MYFSINVANVQCKKNQNEHTCSKSSTSIATFANKNSSCIRHFLSDFTASASETAHKSGAVFILAILGTASCASCCAICCCSAAVTLGEVWGDSGTPSSSKVERVEPAPLEMPLMPLNGSARTTVPGRGGCSGKGGKGRPVESWAELG